MIEKTLDLSTLFRRQLVQTLDEGSMIKERSLEQRIIGVNREREFLVDRKYALNLDEIV